MNTVPGRRAAVLALVAGAALVASVAAALPVWRTAVAREEAAREARVLDADIAFLEGRVDVDPHNHVLSGALIDRYAERFQAAADLDDLRRATRLARRLVVDRPEQPGAWTRLARVLLTQHRFPEAYEAARRAARLAPTEGAVLGVLVDAARSVGAYAEADSALARIPVGSAAGVLRSWRGLVRAGAAPRARRRLLRLCARFDELGRSRDSRAWCRVRLADAALLEGRRDEAERWLVRALRIQPDHRGAIETRAGMALQDERWAVAVGLLERIATPAHPDLYLMLASAYRSQGRILQADAAEARFLGLATAPEALDLNALFLARYYAEGRKDCDRSAGLIRRELERRRSVEVLREAARAAEQCGDGAAARRLGAEASSLVERASADGAGERRRVG